MSKLQTALNAEITRLARREVRKAVTPLFAAVKKLKATNTALKAQIVALKRSLAAEMSLPKVVVSDKELKTARFSGFLIQRLRKRLDLSRAQMGKLIGVSEFAIMGWEKDEYRPRPESQKALIALRKTSKAGAKKMLAKGRKVVV